MVRPKTKAYKKGESINLTSDWEKLKEIKRESRKICQKAYNSFISNCVHDNSSNKSLKRLYLYIKNKIGDSVDVVPLRDQGPLYIDSKGRTGILK